MAARQTRNWLAGGATERILQQAQNLSALTLPPPPAGASEPPPASRANWDLEERNRIIAALGANDWKRQNTAQQLGISRKVLWEKMRKYQISDGEPEVPVSTSTAPEIEDEIDR